MVEQNAKKAPRFQNRQPKKENNAPLKTRKPLNAQETEMREQLSSLDNEIRVMNAAVKEINTKIDNNSSGKSEYETKKEEMNQKITEFEKAIEQALKLRNELSATIEKKINTAREKNYAAQQSRKKLPFKSVEEVNEKIADIEYELMTGIFNVAKERTLKLKLAELNNTSHLLKDMKKHPTNPGDADLRDVGALKAQLEEVKKTLKEAYDRKGKQLDERRNLIESRRDVTKDLKPLFEERAVLRQKLHEKNTLRNDLSDKLFKQIKIWQAEAEEAAKRRAEDAARDRAQYAFDDQLRSLERELRNVELPPNNDRIEDISFAITYLSEYKNPNAGKKRSGISFNMEILSLLGKFKLTMPTKEEDFPALIKSLTDRKQQLVDEQKKALDSVDSRRSAIEKKIAEHKTKGIVVAPIEWRKRKQNVDEEHSASESDDE